MSAAIDHAVLVCAWQENLVDEEMPPKWMWHLEDELEFWFEDVDMKRKAKNGGDDSGDEWSPMMANELSHR